MNIHEEFLQIFHDTDWEDFPKSDPLPDSVWEQPWTKRPDPLYPPSKPKALLHKFVQQAEPEPRWRNSPADSKADWKADLIHTLMQDRDFLLAIKKLLGV